MRCAEGTVRIEALWEVALLDVDRVQACAAGAKAGGAAGESLEIQKIDDDAAALVAPVDAV